MASKSTRGKATLMFLAGALLLLSGCGREVIDDDALRGDLARVLAVEIEAVDCPGGLPADSPGRAECEVSFSKGGSTTVVVRVRKPIGRSPDGEPEPRVEIVRFGGASGG